MTREDDQRAEGCKAVEPDLEASADRSELRCPLEHLEREAAPQQRERRRDPADATTGHQGRKIVG